MYKYSGHSLALGKMGTVSTDRQAAQNRREQERNVLRLVRLVRLVTEYLDIYLEPVARVDPGVSGP